MDKLNQAQAKKVENEVMVLAGDVKNLKVTNQDEFDKAGKFFTDIKAKEKMVKETKEQITKPLNEALKNARDLFKPMETALAEAKTTLQKVLNDYKREQDKKAQEQAAKLQAKIEKGTIKREETILKNLNKIEKVDMTTAGLSETTRKVVDINWKELDTKYLMEILNRANIKSAIEVEIRKDALGNKSKGIEPRIEKGITVRKEKVVQ